MKKIFFITILSIVFGGCELFEEPEHKPFKGILVCKEYIQSHMSDEEPIVSQEASFVKMPYVPVRRPIPYDIPSKWRFYVANKWGVRSVEVDSLKYLQFKIGDKITIE